MEADGTLILTSGTPTGGTAFTIQVALKHKKPYLVVDLKRKPNPSMVLDWANMLKIAILNVAGPRESKIPGIYEMAKNLLESILVNKE